MSPCEIIFVIFGAGVLMTGISAMIMFVGAASLWNIHKMGMYAVSRGGRLKCKDEAYGCYRDVVELPNGLEEHIPRHVSEKTTFCCI